MFQSKRLILAALALSLVATMPFLALAQANASERAGLAVEPLSDRGHDQFPEVLRFSAGAPQIRSPVQNQVRIEQRIVVRVAPMSDEVRRRIRAQQQENEALVLAERPLADCVVLNNITGVGSANDNRLVFLMRDRRLVSARLNRTCSARDFYSGFYVEKHADGRLCVKRDELHTRSGATCAVEGLYRIVAQSK
jgi:hypothetical protein